MGAPLKWYYLRSGTEFSQLYEYSKTPEENKKAGKIPPQDILSFARATSVFWGVLCCVLVFFIGLYCRNIWVGLGAVALLLTNKVFIGYSTRAMTDIHYNFFLLCACLLVILFSFAENSGLKPGDEGEGAAAKPDPGFLTDGRSRVRLRSNETFQSFSRKPWASARGVSFAKSPKEKSLGALSLICGIIAGLAASVKLMGFAVIGLWFLAYLIYQSLLEGKGLRNIFVCMVIFSFSAVVVIYILNPFLWDLKHPLKFPELIKNWITVNSQHGRYYASTWHNARLWMLHRKLLLEYANFRLEGVFLCAGILLFSINLVRALRKKKFNLWVIPFLFFVAN
jgi:4-amino-4-deoxy-L-arabinose transferase-like glycosyltransferase